MITMAQKAHIKMVNTMDKAKSVLKCKKGASMLDIAIGMLISVVIGALALGGIYVIYKNNVFPTLTNKINEMFNFQG